MSLKAVAGLLLVCGILMLLAGSARLRRASASSREGRLPSLQTRQPVLSYSWWGANEAYGYGMLENALLAPLYYPGAEVRVHVDISSVDARILEALAALPHVRIVAPQIPSKGKMCWRFLPSVEENGVCLVRDADSRLGAREADAVAEWLEETDSGWHIMRDCGEGHVFPVVGCCWGSRNGLLNCFTAADLPDKGEWNEDQEWLWGEVYPRFWKEACVHDEKTSLRDARSRRFRIAGDHVGQVAYTAPLAFAHLGEAERRLRKRAMRQVETEVLDQNAHSFHPDQLSERT